MGGMTFEELFTAATGSPPYGYQVRLARDGLPAVVQAPTGAGKTGIVLAWLWRRLHGPAPETVPRRLIFALPQRTLVEQVARQVSGWLDRLGLTDQVALHVVMGGEGHSQWAWRTHAHRPAIVVGTVDSLVSKALNRGYGISRALYPVDFALVTNGAHWVLDEIQLCPESTATLRQLAAFTASLSTAEPFGLTCMSATVSERLLCTVDNPTVPPEQVLRIAPGERVGQLATRLDATRAVRQLAAPSGDPHAVAEAVRQRHRPGHLTLVVVNTVDTARAVHAALANGEPSATLLHSQFRAAERERLIDAVIAEPGESGQIVVSTQVVEAGMDLDAAVLVTEAAPWPSLVQRAGRCNRAGQLEDAELWWLPPDKAGPYPAADLAATAEALAALEGTAVTSEQLLARDVPSTAPEVSVIRRADLLTLFDTAPDLTGADLDISPYVRDTDDLDVQVAWAIWQPGEDGRPPEDAKAPAHRWRCRVPLKKLAALRKRGDLWRYDQAAGRWSKVTGPAPARPGEVLLMAAADGGYHPTRGLDPAAKGPVPDCPVLGDQPAPAAGTEDAYRQDDTSVDLRDRQLLREHSDQTREQARALVDALSPDLPVAAADVVRAAYLHDIGKAHPVWQRALCRLDPDQETIRLASGPWAKSGGNGLLRFDGGVSFRHELASLLLLDGPLQSLLDGADNPDLVRYLVLAHHGKLRVQVRGPDGETGDTDEQTLLGLRHGEPVEIPPVLDRPAGTLTVDLTPFRLGEDRSWSRTALSLRDRYGPFRLAYLETLVRVADWRASAGEPPASAELDPAGSDHDLARSGSSQEVPA